MAKGDVDAELAALDQQFRRVRRRAQHLQRGIGADPARWAARSSSFDEALGVVDRMMRIAERRQFSELLREAREVEVLLASALRPEA